MPDPGLSRVLLVEDDPDIRAVTRFALESIGGLSVGLCASGADAVAAALELAADVVLLDVMMPGLDGPATLRLLRENPATAGIPVVFLTAKVEEGDLLEYRSLGVAGVIPKPFDPLTLAETLRDVFVSRPGAAPGQKGGSE